MSPRLSPDDFYRTNNMALVAFLKLGGHAAQSVLWEGESCYWYFDKSDPLLGLVDDFMEGHAQVEPREFNRVFGLTKRELEHARETQRRSA